MKKLLALLAIIMVVGMVGCSNNEVIDDNKELDTTEKYSSEEKLEERVSEDSSKEEATNNEATNNDTITPIDVKKELVDAGMLKLVSAKDDTSTNDFISYWGSSYRLGGGLYFNDDNTFSFTIGVYEGPDELGGTYTIDEDNNEIKYSFKNGQETVGQYTISNGSVSEVTFVDVYRDTDGPLVVTLRKRTSEEMMQDKLKEAVQGTYALQSISVDGQEVSFDELYGYLNGQEFEVIIDSAWIYGFRFPNNEDLWIEESMTSMYRINENGEVIFSIINLKDTEEERKEGVFKYHMNEENVIDTLTYNEDNIEIVMKRK